MKSAEMEETSFRDIMEGMQMEWMRNKDTLSHDVGVIKVRVCRETVSCEACPSAETRLSTAGGAVAPLTRFRGLWYLLVWMNKNREFVLVDPDAACHVCPSDWAQRMSSRNIGVYTDNRETIREARSHRRGCALLGTTADKARRTTGGPDAKAELPDTRGRGTPWADTPLRWGMVRSLCERSWSRSTTSGSARQHVGLRAPCHTVWLRVLDKTRNMWEVWTCKSRPSFPHYCPGSWQWNHSTMLEVLER